MCNKKCSFFPSERLLCLTQILSRCTHHDEIKIVFGCMWVLATISYTFLLIERCCVRAGTAAVAHNCFYFFSFHRILFSFGSFISNFYASDDRSAFASNTSTSCLLACRDKYSYMQRQRQLMMIMMMIRSHACIQYNVRLRQLRDV